MSVAELIRSCPSAPESWKTLMSCDTDPDVIDIKNASLPGDVFIDVISLKVDIGWNWAVLFWDGKAGYMTHYPSMEAANAIAVRLSYEMSPDWPPVVKGMEN